MKYKLALKSVWFHKKFKDRPFTGSYSYTKTGDRVFVLASGQRQISYESAWEAKKQGWVLQRSNPNA